MYTDDHEREESHLPSLLEGPARSRPRLNFETDKGLPLAPSAKGKIPWYADRNRDLAGTGPQNDGTNYQVSTVVGWH